MSELPVDVLLLWREEANVQLYRRDKSAPPRRPPPREEALRVEKKLNKKSAAGRLPPLQVGGDGNDDGDDGSRAVAVARTRTRAST